MYGADLLPELAHAGTTADTQLNSIATGMTDFSRQHASLGIRIGGLRRRKDLATPAELAAKLTVRPQMADLSAALTVAGLAPDKQVLKRFDSNNQVLHIDFEAQLGLIEKQKRPALVQQITLISKNEWERVRHGHPINAPPPQPLAPWHRLSQREHEHDPIATQDPKDSSHKPTKHNTSFASYWTKPRPESSIWHWTNMQQ